jgi:hypothetical protein
VPTVRAAPPTSIGNERPMRVGLVTEGL